MGSVAHSVKSSAGVFGATLAAAAAMKVEVAGRHGRCQAIGNCRGVVAEQLGQALVGKAVAAHLAVAALKLAGPADAVRPIGGFLGKSPELAAGVPLPRTSCTTTRKPWEAYQLGWA